MKDPEPYLIALDIEVPSALDSSRTAVLDPEHRSRVNWEIYFFASPEEKARFDADPAAHCGWVTDPVTLERIRPGKGTPMVRYEGRPFFFADPSSLARFRENADSLLNPNPPMSRMYHSKD